MTMGKILKARYLNVDFLVEANFDLSPLIEILKEETTLLWAKTSDESSSFGIESNLIDTKSPEEDILELLFILEKLPGELKEILNKSHKKVFDIGFECGRLEKPLNALLSSVILRRINKLNCNINIKIYPWIEKPYDA